MKPNVPRRSASFVARIAARLIRSRHGDWAEAMTAEVDAIPVDGAALAFALGCARAALLDSLRANGASLMNMIFGRVSHPQGIGLLAAILAVACGIAYLFAADAPPRMMIVNGLALVLALAVFPLASAVRRSSEDRSWILSVVAGGALVATALFGASAEGASRWVVVGPLALQPSLILLPTLLLVFARRPGAGTLAGVLLAAAAMALQPDRAMAGVMAAALAALLAMRGGRWTALALAASVAAFAAVMLRPDALPSLPYVDGILFSAFDIHPLMGALLWLGGLSILAPAIAGARRDAAIWAVFGASWLGIFVAAALGNYPTPLVGYGGSAILGYVLSLSFAGASASRAAASSTAVERDDDQPDEAVTERSLVAC